jgi:hypothetical protein
MEAQTLRNSADFTDDEMNCTTISRTSSTFSVQLSPEQLQVVSKPWTQNSEFCASKGSISSIRPNSVPALELKHCDRKKKSDSVQSIISNLNDDLGHYCSLFEKETNKVSEGIQDIFGAAVSSSLQINDVNPSHPNIFSVLYRRLLPTIGIFHGSNSSE